MKSSLHKFLQYIAPAKITLLYIFLGAFFVTFKHDLITFLPRNIYIAKSSNLFIDFSILLATAAIFHIFFINLKNYVETQTIRNNRQFIKNKLAYLSWIFIILLLIPLMNLGIFHHQKPKVEASTYDNLQAIGGVKVQRLTQWLAYRVADGNLLATDADFCKEVAIAAQQQSNSANSSVAKVKSHLNALKSAYHYEHVSLLNRAGQPVLFIGEESNLNNEIDANLLHKVKIAGVAQHGDFFIDKNNHLNIQIITPISTNINGKSTLVAYVLMQTGFYDAILPAIQMWPTSSVSSDVLLVKSVGDKVVIVDATANDFNRSGIYYQDKQADSLYSQHIVQNSPAKSFGKNLVGKNAYSVTLPIDGTSWYFLTEISQQEAMLELNQLLFWIGLSALIFVAIIALVLFLLWKQQKTAYKLALSIKDTELNKLLEKFHTMPFVGFGTVSAKTRKWLEVNPRLCEILGYDAEEIRRLNYTAFNHPDETTIDDEYYEQLKSGKLDYYTREKRFIHKSGKTIYTQVEVTAIRNDYDEIDTNVVSIKDISDHVHAQRALKASEERLDLVVKGSNDGWWDLDLTTNTAHHSPRWWKMLGYDENMDIVDPEHWKTLTHPDDIEHTLKYLRQMLASNKSHYEVELRLQHKDGHYIDVLTRGFILRDDLGKALRIAGTNTDITAFKKADREIITLNRLLSMITNTNKLITRKPGSVVLFNEVCKIAVQDGGFNFAWVGLLTEARDQLKCITYTGVTTSFIESLENNLTNLDYKLPAIQCITEDKHIICNDLANAEYEGLWVSNALESGYRSMVALPISRHGEVVGNFSLFSDEPQAFGQKEIALLDELAADISYALEIEDSESLRKKTEKALTESETLFHNLASNSPAGVFRVDKKGQITYYNDNWRAITNASDQELIDGVAFPTSIHAEDSKAVSVAFHKCLHDKVSFNMEFRFSHPNQSVIWVKCQAQPCFDDKGVFNGFVGTLTDVTELKNVQDSLYMAGIVIDHSREAILVTDSNVNIMMVNKAFTEIEGYTAEEIIGKNPSILNSGRQDSHYFSAMYSSLKDTGVFQSEIWNRRKNGEIHPGILSITTVKNANQKITHYVSVFTDITSLKNTEERLAFLANHDTLTGLPNRMMLISHISHAIEGAKRKHKHIALLLLDLDRFKNVNDSFGHLAGDDLLQQLSAKLKTKLRGNDLMARLGGDEFVVVLEDVSNPEYAAKVAENIIQTIQEPWHLHQHNAIVNIGTSIGISLYPDHGDNSLDLLKHADAALYQAKGSGRGVAKYYSENLTRQARRRFKLETKLREAISNNELKLHYQPKLDVFTGKIISAEALVRWVDPKVGMIMPNEFISIAEETGLIAKLGEWVLREACRQGREWLDKGLDLAIAVNISATQLYHDDITKTISDTLKTTGFPAKNLELELTESILMRREAESIKKLYQIKELGITLAVDDFGAGYSSLSYLRRFPLDVLKIDRSFVADLDDDKDDRAITATIIGIGRTLNLKVVAEGVETASQLAFLASHGCHMYQGFYASPALEAKLLEEFIAAYKGNNIF